MAGTFRKDIEGLRALAVLPILAFHLDPAWCPGGFMGVDIFFVISGYLITQMIVRDGSAFSFRTFYVRRIFRLFPALLVTLWATLIAGWWVLGPADYDGLGRSALAAAFGVSNVYFLATIDYFNAASLSHPLLHTWSLGAEEQFYLLWPALVVWARRWQWPLLALVAGAGLVSFAAVLALQPSMPDATFYMMPFRIFEFALGALLVAIEGHDRAAPSAVTALAGAAGTALLTAGFVFVDTETPWPGMWTLSPAVATALLIFAGSRGFWCALLGNPVFRFFGVISYSLYLVHWPIITLYRTYAITDPQPWELAVLGVASIAAGAGLYALVEKPFRGLGRALTGREAAAGHPWMRRLVLPGLGGAAVALLVGSIAVIATEGFPSRLDRTRVQKGAGELTFAGDLCSYKRARCVFGDPAAAKTVYVIGDSHALNLIYGLDQLFRARGIKGIAFYDHGCLFLNGTARYRRGAPDARCAKNIADAYAYLSQNRHPVILAGNFAGYQNSMGSAGGTAPVKGTVEEYYRWLSAQLEASLSALNPQARKVILIGQSYTTGIDLAKCLSQPGTTEPGRCKVLTLEAVREKFRLADDMVRAQAGAFPGLVTIDPKSAFCASQPCATSGADGLYFRDSDHLTNAGSVYLVDKIGPALLNAIGMD